jgi:tRNA(fMet)-specific endonuclease VapC
MKRFLLDSNAVNEMMSNRDPFSRQLAEARRTSARIGTCEPVVAELLHGIELSHNREQNMIRLGRTLHLLYCWPLDRAASQTYGIVAAELRRIGRPMQTIDIMLAAIAMSLGNCTVVTCDSDLFAVPGLSVVNWQNEPMRI